METKQNQTQVILQAQYAKDISFKSITPPIEFAKLKTIPKIEMKLEIKTQNLEQDVFEVMLKITAKSITDSKDIYLVELEYAGIFFIKNIDTDEQKNQILLIHCPNLLFPFARHVIAELTRECGYQPLMMNPMNFASLYAQQKQNQDAGAMSQQLEIDNTVRESVASQDAETKFSQILERQHSNLKEENSLSKNKNKKK